MPFRSRLFTSFCLFALLSLCAVTALSQSIRLTIPNMTAAGGETIQALELGVAAPMSVSSGGSTTQAKATAQDLLLKKQSDSSYVLLLGRMVLGQMIPSAVIEYSNPAINGGKPYLILTLTDVFVTRCNLLSPECPGCSKTEVEVSLNARTILFDDKVGKVRRLWNLATSTFTNQ